MNAPARTSDRYWSLLLSAAQDCEPVYPKDAMLRYAMVTLHYGASIVTSYRDTPFRDSPGTVAIEDQVSTLADLVYATLAETEARTVSAN